MMTVSWGLTVMEFTAMIQQKNKDNSGITKMELAVTYILRSYSRNP